MEKIKAVGNMMLSVVMLLFCSSCSAIKPDSIPESEIVNTAAPLKMLITDNIYTMGCGADEGYYYVQPRADNYLTANIRYIDYASLTDVPLSSQVNSEHSNSDDSSYLDSIIGDYRLFFYNEHLYYLRTGASYYVDNSEFGKLAASAIYRMNPDGSNRELIYQGDGASELLPYAIGNESALYFLRQTIEGVELLCLQGENYSQKTVFQFSLGTTFVGCSGSLIYYLSMDTENDNSSFTLSSFDTQNGQVTKVLEWDLENYGEPLIVEQALYMVRPWKRGIDQYTLTGEKTKEISFDQFYQDTAVTYEKVYLAGETIVIPCYDNATQRYYNILVNTAANSLSCSNLVLESTEKDSIAAVIVANTSENYLAITKRAAEKCEMPLGDGTTQSVEAQVYGYTLFSREDFENSRLEGARAINKVS